VLLVFLPFFTGAAAMATVYPLFIVVASDSDPISASKAGAHHSDVAEFPL
jgi:hypothetical protein